MHRAKHARAHAGVLQMKLAKTQQRARKMRRTARLMRVKEQHEKAAKRKLERTSGSRLRETQSFTTYMSRWWRLHRKFMKRHNPNLYKKLRQHRALSLSHFWKPFLLRWKYVQPRLLQGFRYNWKDDGTYETKRFLMKSKRKLHGKMVEAKIRSVNNICFPGFLAPNHKRKICNYSKPVSSRAVQFELAHLPFQEISITSLRAYTLFTPKLSKGFKKFRGSVKDFRANHPAQRRLVSFVGIQQIKWEILEMIEYCDVLDSKIRGASVPVPYNPKTSSPKRQYALKFMEWQPLKMQRELLDSGATVEKIALQRIDGKIKISCVIPVKHPQSIYGEQVDLSTEKCTFYMNHWFFDLKCPKGKKPALALATRTTSRDSAKDGVQSGHRPVLTPRFEQQLAFNKNKMVMQFEQEAVIHTTTKSKSGKTTVTSRNSVPVKMTQGNTLEWTSDPRFRNSRLCYFSFIVSDAKNIKEGTLKWDPEIRSAFKLSPKVLKTTILPVKHSELNDGGTTVVAKDENSAFVQLDAAPSSSAEPTTFSKSGEIIAVVFAVALNFLRH